MENELLMSQCEDDKISRIRNSTNISSQALEINFSVIKSN